MIECRLTEIGWKSKDLDQLLNSLHIKQAQGLIVYINH